MSMPLSTSEVPLVPVTDFSDSDDSHPIPVTTITDPELADAFTTVGITDSTLQGSLIERFSDNIPGLKNILQVLANTAPDDHGPVDGQRLGNILCGVSAFDCGKQQLLDFSQSCMTNELRLSFVTPNAELASTLSSEGVNDHYALQSSKLLAQDRVIYISVNPSPPETDERYIGKLNLTTRKIFIEKLKTHELISPPKTVEGYKVGHELSHATAWIKHFEKMK
jgi:hypothetical protein